MYLHIKKSILNKISVHQTPYSFIVSQFLILNSAPLFSIMGKRSSTLNLTFMCDRTVVFSQNVSDLDLKLSCSCKGFHAICVLKFELKSRKVETFLPPWVCRIPGSCLNRFKAPPWYENPEWIQFMFGLPLNPWPPFIWGTLSDLMVSSCLCSQQDRIVGSSEKKTLLLCCCKNLISSSVFC